MFTRARRSTRLLAVVVAAGVLSACGGGGDKKDATAEPAAKTTRTTKPDKPASGDDTATKTNPVIREGDIVGVDCGGGDDIVVMRFGVDGTGEKAFVVDEDALAATVGVHRGNMDLVPLVGPSCKERDKFNADFSKYVYAISGHVLLVDTRTMKVTDLTALRQTSSYESAGITENHAYFSSARDRFALTDTIVINGNSSNPIQVDANNPKVARPYTLASIDEMSAGGFSNPGELSSKFLVSPDGRLAVTAGFGGGVTVWLPTDQSKRAVAPESCHGPFATLLGWVDNRRVAMLGEDPATKRRQVYIGTVTPQATWVSCDPAAPPTERDTTAAFLTFDRKRIAFTLDSATGESNFAVHVDDATQAEEWTGPVALPRSPTCCHTYYYTPIAR